MKPVYSIYKRCQTIDGGNAHARECCGCTAKSTCRSLFLASHCNTFFDLQRVPSTSSLKNAMNSPSLRSTVTWCHDEGCGTHSMSLNSWATASGIDQYCAHFVRPCSTKRHLSEICTTYEIIHPSFSLLFWRFRQVQWKAWKTLGGVCTVCSLFTFTLFKRSCSWKYR